jgi:hypothetical protein
MRACVRSHIFGHISSKIGEDISLRGLHAFYVCTCVCTLCACVQCTHNIDINIYARSHILGQTLSKLLRVTESCMGYLIFTCAFACARYAHVCIRTFFYVFVPNLVETFLCMGYMLFTLAFAHYARTMYALLGCLYCMHVRVHTFLDGFFPNLVEHSTGHRDMHGLLDFYMHDCVCALSEYVHFRTDSPQTW